MYLFGPLRVAVDDRPVPLSAPPRTGPLLAYLALHPTPQDRSTVAAALWPDSDPAEARTNLRRHLHYLRQALPEHAAGPWLLTNGSRVGLDLDAGLWVDTHAFEEAAARGDLVRAAALYTGHLLTDHADEWLLVERERLRGVLHGVLLDLAERHRSAGRGPEALAVLDRLLREDPLREDAVRLTMRVRYGTGDRAGALAVYERFAEVLANELRVEPMQQTRTLFEALVRELDPPGEGAPTRADAPPKLPFVGRTRELATLVERWDRARSGRGGLVLLAGPAGIGKSRLLRRLAERAKRDEGRALAGGTAEPEESPYQAVAEALRPIFGLLVAAGDRSASWRRVLAAALPAAASTPPAGTPLPELPPDRERARLFHAVGRALLDVARTRPLLLVLEDLQDAGEASVALLGHLARRARDAPLLIVATYRDDRLGPDHPLRTLRRRLEDDGSLDALTLGGLDTEAIETLLSQLAPATAAPEVAAALEAASAGNPLLIAELLHEAATAAGTATTGPVAPGLPRTGSAWTEVVPDGVRRRVAARLERLAPEARTFAGAAAAVGESFRLETVRDVLAWNEREALDALDLLLDARLVRERRPGSFSFGHQLMREAIYRSVEPSARTRYHRRAAHALERFGAADASAATLARHYDLGGEPDRAARYGLRAARDALEAGAGEEARHLASWSLALAHEPRLRLELHRMTEDAARRRGDRQQQRLQLDAMDALAEALGDEEASFDAATRRVVLLRELGDCAAEAECLQRLAERAAADGRPAWLARAALLQAGYDLARGDPSLAEERLGQATDLAKRAHDRRIGLAATCLGVHVALATGRLELVRHRLGEAQRTGATDEPELVAEALRAALYAAIGQEAFEEAFELTARMLRLAIDTCDRSLEADAHQYRAVSAARLARLAEAKAHYRVAERLYRELERPQGLAAVSLNRGVLDLRLGDHVAAADRLEHAARLFARLGDRRGETLCVLNGASALLYGRRHEDARHASERALALAREGGNDLLAASALSNLGDAERHLGARAEAIEHLCQALAIERRLGRDASSANALCELALVYLEEGRLDRASAAADELLTLLHKRGDELLHPQQVAWVAARVRHAQGEEDAARKLAARAAERLRAMAGEIEDERALAAFLAMEFNREIAAAEGGAPWPGRTPGAGLDAR